MHHRTAPPLQPHHRCRSSSYRRGSYRCSGRVHCLLEEDRHHKRCVESAASQWVNRESKSQLKRIHSSRDLDQFPLLANAHRRDACTAPCTASAFSEYADNRSQLNNADDEVINLCKNCSLIPSTWLWSDKVIANTDATQDLEHQQNAISWLSTACNTCPSPVPSICSLHEQFLVIAQPACDAVFSHELACYSVKAVECMSMGTCWGPRSRLAPKCRVESALRMPSRYHIVTH